MEARGGGPRSSFSHLRPRAPWAARGSARFPGNSAPVRKRARACRREIVSEDCAGEGTGKWHPTPGFLPGESHGQRSLAGYSPRDCTESDTTERLNSNFPWPHSTSPSVHDPTGNHCLLFLASLPRGGSSINKCIPSMDILTPFCVPTTPHAFWSFLL